MADVIGNDDCYRYSRAIFSTSFPTIQSPLKTDTSSKPIQSNMQAVPLSAPKKPRRKGSDRRHAIEATPTLTPEASDASSQSSKRPAQSVVVSPPRNEILSIIPTNATFDATPSGMPTPLTGRPEGLDKPFDGIKSLEALTVERLNEIIAKQVGRITLEFPVSFEDFREWAVGKEEIGRYQYDSSIQRLIITADGGPVHEHTTGAMFVWLNSFAQKDNRVIASLAPPYTLFGLDNERIEPSEQHPDCCLILGDQEAPRIVVEVGFTESFEDLYADARKWLYGSYEVHRVFLIQIKGKDHSKEFKTIMEAKEGSKSYSKYLELLRKENEAKDPVPDSEKYCDRLSYVYGLTAEDLAGQNVQDLKVRLRTWHEKHFPLYICQSATFYIYRRDASEPGEIEKVGEQVYWTSDNAPHDSLRELSRCLTYDDLFGDGSSQIVNPDDYLPAEALREALTYGLKGYTVQQIKEAVTKLKKIYDKWEQMRKGKGSVQETPKEHPRGSKDRPLRSQESPRPSYKESSTSSEHLPAQTTSSPSPPLPVRIPGHPSPPLGDSVASQPVVKKRKRGAVLDQLEQVGQGIKRFARKVSGGRKGL
ncbi:uncharacterized protein PAC_00443 [Phialocephala subalpina]|uniref:Uncharacterized protein n=1 Tax=Phialocephala subalpina TaxID=576137 RepID=A0A1L7WD08_9HELO|nr:uncharacterized protein PAC_00443 [Phialocephala subalpina]